MGAQGPRIWVVLHCEVVLNLDGWVVDEDVSFVASSRRSAERLIRSVRVDPGSWWRVEAARLDCIEGTRADDRPKTVYYSSSGRRMTSPRIRAGYRAAILREKKAARMIAERLPGWKEIRLALEGRSRRCGKRRATTGAEGSSRRADRLIERILREGPKVWSPDYACFRQNRHFSAKGRRYLVLHDGLWHEGTNEVSLLIQSDSKITRDDWKSIKASGFVEALAAEIDRLGYKVETRARFAYGRFFVQFAKQVDRRTIRREARRLLNWRYPRSLSMEPMTRHSPRLFHPDELSPRA